MISAVPAVPRDAAPRRRRFLIRGQSSLPPPLDRRRVLLAGHLLRLLRTESQIVQNPTHMVGMVLHAKLLADHFGHAGRRPQVGAITRPRRDRLSKSRPVLLSAPGQLGRRSRMGLGGQGRHAAVLPRTLPTLHAGETGTDKSGDFCERLPFLEILRSTTTTSFQLRRTAFGSHKLPYGASDY